MTSIFNKIIKKEIAAEIFYEDNNVIAFYDIKPLMPGHFLVVPKKFSQNLIDISEKDLVILIKKARKLAIQEIKKNNKDGFKLVINNGQSSGQEIFHTHVHIIPY